MTDLAEPIDIKLYLPTYVYPGITYRYTYIRMYTCGHLSVDMWVVRLENHLQCILPITRNTYYTHFHHAHPEIGSGSVDGYQKWNSKKLMVHR
jgi:hypothetical protein